MDSQEVAETTAPNPFSAPTADIAQIDENAAAQESLGQIAKRVFLAWEKLRFLYILILAVECLLLGSRMFTEFEFWGAIVVGGIGSNVCFFLGPIVETYLTWLGFRAEWLRMLLFVLGTLFTMVAALAVLATIGFPTQS